MKALIISVIFGGALGVGSAAQAAQPDDHLVFEAKEGAGSGKHIVFLSGDEEYRSEESMPMMAQILASQGFKCTVLFSLNADGVVDPTNQKSLSHSESLDKADAIVMCLRFRNWDDTSMERFEAALNRGVPVVALRTSTHAFKFGKDSKWAKYSFNAGPDTGWKGGFGRHILGETWINHHGKHKVQGTRTIVEEANAKHPVLNGVGSIFAETDVYGANPPADATILLRGQVTKTLQPDSEPVEGKKNNPVIPVAWVRTVKADSGKDLRICTTTMGAASDLDDANLRRLVANGVYWGLGMEVPKEADVTLPGVYKPTFYGFGTFLKGKKPADFILKGAAAPDAAPAAAIEAPKELRLGKTKG